MRRRLLRVPLVIAATLASGSALAAVAQSKSPAAYPPTVGFYVPVDACRVVDTRLTGPPIGANETRLFGVFGGDLSQQGGSPSGCGMPWGMAGRDMAVMLNVTATQPAGWGFLRVYPPDQPEPFGVTLTYRALQPSLNFTNALPVRVAECITAEPIPQCDQEIAITARHNATHVVVDVVGYFSRWVKASLPLHLDGRLEVEEGIFVGSGGEWGSALQASSGRGVAVVATSTHGISLLTRSGSPGVVVDIRRAGDGGSGGASDTSVGNISLGADGETVSYNAFTGSHYAWSDMAIEPGTLVALTGSNLRLGGRPHGEMIYGIRPANGFNEAAVLGAYGGRLEPDQPGAPFTDNPALVQAVGNGELWVVDAGGDLSPGDLLVSSTVPGHAMKLPANLESAFVVARVAEPVRWRDVQLDAQGRRRAKISVLFEPGARTSTEGLYSALATLREDHATLRVENERLRLQVAELVSAVRLGGTLKAAAEVTTSSTTARHSGH